MNRLFSFDIHIGRWKVLLGSHDIQNGSVTANHIAPCSITGDKIKDKSITGEHIAPQSITGGKLAPESVGAEAIAPNAVVAGNISKEAINASHIAPGTIDGRGLIVNSNLIAVELEGNKLYAYYGCSYGCKVKIERAKVYLLIDEEAAPGEIPDPGRAVCSEDIVDETIRLNDLSNEVKLAINKGGSEEVTDEDMEEIINY